MVQGTLLNIAMFQSIIDMRIEQFSAEQWIIIIVVENYFKLSYSRRWVKLISG